MAEFTGGNPDELGTGSLREKPHVLKLLQTWISELKATRNICGDNVSPWKTPHLMLKGRDVHCFVFNVAESLE